MAYQAIYRRWRPTVFDDVIGQDHITKTLKNQIINGSTAHAYLFCGTRGTGKTSTAKILARAVNCLDPQEGNPCNTCAVCQGLLDETIMDVVELDGASKNKVENIREIIDDVMFLPSVAKKKVYIIDEVHMVTTSAFNALLKTLEEPPAHVMFILATTELNKVPITVLSRCQQFEFRRITNRDIASRMETILAADGAFAEPAALALIAELGDGSMRDSLSVLDKCIGAADDRLTYDDVVKIVGIADSDAQFDLASHIAAGNTKGALEKLDEVIEKGKELGLFAERFLKYLRDILVVKATQNSEAFLNTSEENKGRIEQLAEQFSKERLIRSIDLLCSAYQQAKYAGFSRTVYEMALVKMCEPDMEETQEALLDRISVLEEAVAKGAVSAPAQADGLSAKEQQTEEAPPWESQKPQPTAPEPEPAKAAKLESAEMAPESAKKAAGDEDPASRWPEIVNYVKSHGGMPIYPHLTMVRTKMQGGKFCLIFGDNALVSKTVVSKPATIKLIQDAVEKVTGSLAEVVCVTSREIGDEEDNPLKKLEELSKTNSAIEFI